MKGLTGKAAIVTGSGIGRAIAERLAAEGRVVSIASDAGRVGSSGGLTMHG